jgi:hypothetical protein
MKDMGLHARGLSILGVFICVLMLTGASCSGANAMAAVSKSVSTTYYVSGFVTCDHNDDGTWFNDSDHPEQYFYVWYQIEGDSTTYVLTTRFGYYYISRGEDVYVDVWLMPAPEAPHWGTYYRDLGQQTDWNDPNPVIRVPANTNGYVSFIGSDH